MSQKITLPPYDFELFKNSPDIWLQLRNRCLFITGGTGFMGKYLLQALIFANDYFELNVKVEVLSRNPQQFLKSFPHFNRSFIKFRQGEITSFDFLDQKFDLILHGATDASAKLAAENPQLMLDTIYHGTARVLEFARNCQAEKLLFLSSGAVYGKQPSELTHVPEECFLGPDFLNPSNSYGEGKRVAELLCSFPSNHSNTEIKIARCFAFVGPYLPLDTHFAVGNFMRDVLDQQKNIIISGDGRPLRSYLYGADMVIWLMTVLLQGKHLRPYNVGSDQEINIKDLANCVREVARELGFERVPELKVLTDEDPLTAPPRYVPSIARAMKELGLTSKTSLHEAIKQTLLWHSDSGV